MCIRDSPPLYAKNVDLIVSSKTPPHFVDALLSPPLHKGVDNIRYVSNIHLSLSSSQVRKYYVGQQAKERNLQASQDKQNRKNSSCEPCYNSSIYIFNKDACTVTEAYKYEYQTDWQE